MKNRLFIIPLLVFLLASCNTAKSRKKHHPSSATSLPDEGEEQGEQNTSSSSSVQQPPEEQHEPYTVGPVSGRDIDQNGKIIGTSYVYDIPVQNYYDSISDSLTVTALLNALNTLNNQKRKKLVGYSGTTGAGFYCDNHGEDGVIFGFYDNTRITKVNSQTVNREHVWPASRTIGGRNEESDPIEQDCLHIRPTNPATNEDRGNLFYGSSSPNFDAGYEIPEFRGEAARIIFYCAIADKQLSIVDQNNISTAVEGKMGKLSDLLRWHIQYPPTANDLYRNSGAQYKQGNRNPFADHPEYACRIWGSTNATTKSICGM